ncbi:MAG: hypothetical protein B6245_14765 [Desulfobacteraceae bacterium 4572_88]|nr:MAG: hypothetical protein B6245_14765 [Desulfobacteraceae bacterium 4572_88]
MKFIDPRTDFAFKKIFGSEDTRDILTSFLESLMGLGGEKPIGGGHASRPLPATEDHNINRHILKHQSVDPIRPQQNRLSVEHRQEDRRYNLFQTTGNLKNKISEKKPNLQHISRKKT